MGLGHLYNYKYSKTKSVKINYFSAKLWRSMYLISSNSIYQTSHKRTYSRSSTIPYLYSGYEIVVYSGKRWHTRYVNSWMVGYKAGEFTWNRRLALYKAKQLRKKNKKNKK